MSLIMLTHGGAFCVHLKGRDQPMICSFLCDADVALVRAFVAREAVDFKPQKDAAWIERKLESLVTSVQALLKETKINRFIVESLGNAGVVLRSVSMDPRGSYWQWD